MVQSSREIPVGQPINVSMPKKKGYGKKIGIIAIMIFFLATVGCSQNNANEQTTQHASFSHGTASSEITEKPTPRTILVETLPAMGVEQDQTTLNTIVPDTSEGPVDTVEQLTFSEPVSESKSEPTVPEIEDVGIGGTHQPVTMSFYDASELKGRGLRDYAGEPNYIGAIGYAAVFNEAGLESMPDYADTPWKVPTYIRSTDGFVQSGFITHKTKIGIIRQELTKQNGREYQGFLEFQELETGMVGFINVKNFVTVPYWDQDVMKAVAKGYGIAVFRQISQYIPVYKDGKKATVKKESKVLLPARGTYYVSTMNRADYQIVGIVFETKNNRTEPQYVFFNKNDLRMVY